ncbi:hypothetical protein AX15_007316 [Amanita polypyramis BW_CC]|nr:hypothetical protein AX15_007316 [Amanita polypyramis BW_CC]
MGLEKLYGSEYGTPEDIEATTRYFDKTTKPSFKGSSKPYCFGRNEKDEQFDIRTGNVKVNGLQIADFFEPAIQKTIEDQSMSSTIPIRAVFMVRGFATSHYLFFKLDEYFKTRNVEILGPDTYLDKAVAEGPISFTIDHPVTSRVSRYIYGITYCPYFNLSDPDHISRAHTYATKPSGARVVPGGFSGILLKDIEVSEEKEFREAFCNEYTERGFRWLLTKTITIKCYRDRKNKAPAWIDAGITESSPDEPLANVLARSQVSPTWQQLHL